MSSGTSSDPAPPDWAVEQAKLWRRLVPPSGPSASLQGELIRLTGKLTDEAFRNGNLNWSSDHRAAWVFVRDQLLGSGVFTPEASLEIEAATEEILSSPMSPPSDPQSSGYYLLTRRAVEFCSASPAPVWLASEELPYSV